MSDAPQIQLGGMSASLVRPSPLMSMSLLRSPEQLEIIEPAEMWALGAAALYACWPPDLKWPTTPRPRPWRVGQKVLDHGQVVFDALVNAGVPLGQLLPALTVALAWAQQGAFPVSLEQAKDFSSPPAGG